MSDDTLERARRHRSSGEYLRYIALYAACVLMTMVTVSPFAWMLSTSFKDPRKAVTWPPQLWPDPFILSNYAGLFQYGDIFPFHRFIFNSVYISLLVVCGRVFFSALGGYAFARIRFPGSNIAFGLLMAAFLMPMVIRLIPLYIMYQHLGWLDTHLPLIVPGMLSSSFGTFLMRQFFMTLPQELVEAARIDGCGRFGIFWRVMLPLSKPALAALAIFSFQGVWNDFYTPFVFINRLPQQTLQVGLRAFAQEETGDTSYTYLMAGGVLALLPVMTLYFSVQKYFVQGIALTGIKG